LRKLLVDPPRVADVDDQGDEPDRGAAAARTCCGTLPLY
jgi:hypothetical protein